MTICLFAGGSATAAVLTTSFRAPKCWNQLQEPSFPEAGASQAGNPDSHLPKPVPPAHSPFPRSFRHGGLKDEGQCPRGAPRCPATARCKRLELDGGGGWGGSRGEGEARGTTWGALTPPTVQPREPRRYLQHAFPTRPGRVDKRVVQIKENGPDPAQPHLASRPREGQTCSRLPRTSEAGRRRTRKTWAEPGGHLTLPGRRRNSREVSQFLSA